VLADAHDVKPQPEIWSAGSVEPLLFPLDSTVVLVVMGLKHSSPT
jgi:hypothetical protein